MPPKIPMIKAKTGVKIAGQILVKARSVYFNYIPKLAEEYFRLGYKLGVQTVYKQMKGKGITFPVRTTVRIPLRSGYPGRSKYPPELILSAEKPGRKKTKMSKIRIRRS
jgi:hypothetical protein